VKCGPSADRGIEHSLAVRDQDDGERILRARELIDLLDQDVESGAIFVMSLHLRACRGDVVGLVDHEQPSADLPGAPCVPAGMRR